MEKDEVEFNYVEANHGRPARHSQASSHLNAVIVRGRFLMKTSHSVSSLSAVHLVPNGGVPVNSVGHVRMKRNDEASVF